jgi:addiction module RelB/DinJ family antitoxin
MATVLVAGRVDKETKERADVVIRRAGLTQADVIRTVWSNIATTGKLPSKESATEPAGSGLSARLRELRALTPRSEFLENLTPEGLHEELSHHE